MIAKKFTIVEEEKGQRLDVFLSEKLDISRAQAQKMIEQGGIILNGKKPKKSGEKLSIGHTIELQKIVEVKKPKEAKVKKENLFKKIKIVAETNDYLIINKPAGLLVHPTEAGEEDTLAHYLVKNYPELQKVGEDPVRPGIVHRLDREASGLLVVAKTQKMFKHLKSQFKKSEIVKEYKVLVHEVIDKDIGTIDFLIDRGPDGRMVARPKIDELSLRHVNKIQPGKISRTDFTVEKRFVNYTYLTVRIHTGRTHQIRVHMFAYGYPVVGDTLYYNKRFKKYTKGLERLFLHAYHLAFKDLKGKNIDTTLDLPIELQKFLKTLT